MFYQTYLLRNSPVTHVSISAAVSTSVSEQAAVSAALFWSQVVSSWVLQRQCLLLRMALTSNVEEFTEDASLCLCIV